MESARRRAARTGRLRHGLSATAALHTFSWVTVPADAASPQPISIDGDTYIDDRTLAKILGCSRVTLQQARTRGEGIPYVKIGREPPVPARW